MATELLDIPAFLYNAAIQEPNHAPQIIGWKSRTVAELESYQQEHTWQCEENPKMRSAYRATHYVAVGFAAHCGWQQALNDIELHKDTVRDKNSEIKTQTNPIVSLTTDIDRLENRVKELEQEAAENLQDGEQQIGDLQQQIGDFQRQMEDQREQYNCLSLLLLQQDEEINRLHEELEERKEDLVKANTEIRNLQKIRLQVSTQKASP
ncbi:UNVERIFIED_CONTAM: hypothetical protein FKN15_002476 [Acipenser sinensis]